MSHKPPLPSLLQASRLHDVVVSLHLESWYVLAFHAIAVDLWQNNVHLTFALLHSRSGLVTILQMNRFLLGSNSK